MLARPPALLLPPRLALSQVEEPAEMEVEEPPAAEEVPAEEEEEEEDMFALEEEEVPAEEEAPQEYPGMAGVPGATPASARWLHRQAPAALHFA